MRRCPCAQSLIRSTDTRFLGTCNAPGFCLTKILELNGGNLVGSQVLGPSALQGSSTRKGSPRAPLALVQLLPRDPWERPGGSDHALSKMRNHSSREGSPACGWYQRACGTHSTCPFVPPSAGVPSVSPAAGILWRPTSAFSTWLSPCS